MFRPSVPDHLLALTTFQSRCVKTVSCLPPQGGHNILYILYILPIYCQYNAHIQKMISSSCRMSWAFWLEGVCIPIISTFGLLGKVFLQLFFSLKLSFNFQATSAPSGFWAAGGPTWTSAQRSPPFLFVWWAIMLGCLSQPPCCLSSDLSFLLMIHSPNQDLSGPLLHLLFLESLSMNALIWSYSLVYFSSNCPSGCIHYSFLLLILLFTRWQILQLVWW